MIKINTNVASTRGWVWFMPRVRFQFSSATCAALLAPCVCFYALRLFKTC
ncbi:hypothetical protein HMPREF3232_00114 [Fannyhessea vaginae]|nr:hypothetical protein HMPREF3232_00114 [Fannyhessea vaginae]